MWTTSTRMRMRRLLPCLLSGLLPACDPAGDPCRADGPIQLVQGGGDSRSLAVEFAGHHTYLGTRGIWVNGIDSSLHVGPACGAGAHEIGRGLDMAPVRLHPDDPDAEDPHLVCDRAESEFYRIDLTGERPPELLLPYLDCNRLVATPHGPVIAERRGHTLWHLPRFPDDTGAIELATPADDAVWLGDRLLYVGEDGIHRRDLATGADELLVPGAIEFLHTATHLLWKGHYDGDAAPMSVRDLATGVDHPVGLHHDIEDNPDWDDPVPGPGWRFDADGRHVLHLPNTPDSLMSAHDLTGAPVPFAGAGRRLAYPAVGGVVVEDDGTIRHAFAGSADGTRLAVPDDLVLDDLQLFDDHLEVRTADNALHAVPLDGGPSIRLAVGIPAERVRIDDTTLLIFGGHTLGVVHQPTNRRRVFAIDVTHFVYHPGRGLYFSQTGRSAPALDGIWMLADDRVRAGF